MTSTMLVCLPKKYEETFSYNHKYTERILYIYIDPNLVRKEIDINSVSSQMNQWIFYLIMNLVLKF